MNRSFVFAAVVCLHASIVYAEPITYQGRLDDNGVPAEGIYDFRFQLLGSPDAGPELTPTLSISDVPVNGGVFAVELDFPNFEFDVDSWLLIQLKKDAESGFTIFPDRVKITPAPQAVNHRLEPWAASGQNLTTGDGDTRVLVNREEPLTDAVYFTVGTPAGAGEPGGLYVLGAHPLAIPLIGLFNDGGTNAVFHYFDGSSGEWRFSNNGDRLIIEPGGEIVMSGNVTSGGVVAADDFTYNFARTGYVSVNCASFQPTNDGEDYFISDTSYFNQAGQWVAGVQIPHGATVTNFWLVCRDLDDTTGMRAVLRRVDDFGNALEMARAETTAAFSSSIYVRLTDSTIDEPFINNAAYSYQVRVTGVPTLDSAAMRLARVRISYTMPGPD